MKWLFVVGILFLGACTGYTAEFIEKAKGFADNSADIFLAGTCAIDLGSYYRLENPNHRAGATLICDPNAKAPMRKEDVLRLLED